MNNPYNLMTDRDVQVMRESARSDMERGFTKEEALDLLTAAGIVDADGNLTETGLLFDEYVRNNRTPPLFQHF